MWDKCTYIYTVIFSDTFSERAKQGGLDQPAFLGTMQYEQGKKEAPPAQK